MWTATKDFAETNRFKHYSKRHPREVASCFSNLDRLLSLLDSGLTLDQLASFRFFSSEGDGIFRIAQTGVPNSHETRLYVYVATFSSQFHVLTIGDKSTQQDDINRCKSIACRIPKQEVSQQ